MSKSTYLKLDAFDAVFLHGLLHNAALQCGIDRVRAVPDEHLPPEIARARKLMLKVEKAVLFTNNRQVQKSVYHDQHPSAR